MPGIKNIYVAVLTRISWAIVCVAWFWALIALLYLSSLSGWMPWILALAWIALSAVLLWNVSRPKNVWGLLCGIFLVWLICHSKRPSNERDWVANHEYMPFAHFQRTKVTIENVRNTTYRTIEDYDVVWNVRQYDLDCIQTVDFIVEPFSSWRGLAHTFLTFGFENGEYIAISAEIRKEKGESYSPLKGLFRNYEIIYVIGDETDLIGVRANIRNDPVYVFPIAITRGQARSLFISMVNRANQLTVKPEFYHSLLNNCTTNILRHVNQMRRDKVRFDWRTVFPGYSEDLAWELGLIRFNGTLEEARQHFLINNRSDFQLDSRLWSEQIRTGPRTSRY